MEINMETINVNGVEYVKKEDMKDLYAADLLDNMPYVIVRTYSAGVFAGYLKERVGREVTLKNARRLWYWDGAASLSELAVHGTSKPDNCKFPCEVNTVDLLEAIEILEVSKKAQESIKNVPIWKA